MAIKNFTIPTGLDVDGAITATTTVTANGVVLTGNTGTVTSVAATVPAFLSVSGTPVTTNGTLTIGLSGTALPVINGGTGTTTPSLIAGTNVNIIGSWPNQTINASSGSVVFVVLNDITNQFNNITSVFALKNEQENVINIVDSRDIQVVVGGQTLSPYITRVNWPFASTWFTPYDSYRGFRVKSNSVSSNVIIYNSPAIGDQATITIINSSSVVQTRRYPYSPESIALGD